MTLETSAVSAPDKTKPVRLPKIKKQGLPPQQEPLISAPEKTKKSGSRLGQKIATGIITTVVILEGAGAIATELTNGQPESAQTLKVDLIHPWGFIDNLLTGINTQPEAISSNFNNSAESQTIRMGVNTIAKSKEEVSELLKNSVEPSVRGEYPKASFLFPIELTNNQKIEESVLYTWAYNNMTGESNKAYPCGKTFTIPDKNTKIIIPVEGAEVFQIRFDKSPNGDSRLRSILLRFTDNETLYELEIQPQNPKQITAMDILNNAPVLVDDGTYIPGQNSKPDMKGLPLPAGESIAIINSGNAKIDIMFGTPASKKISSLNYVIPNGVISAGFNLLTSKDVDGNEKIVTLASQ
jgi:hypothetical protein